MRADTGPRAALFALLMSVLGLGAPPAGRAESLPDAWRMALEADAALAAARGERSAADAERLAAERARWPALDVSGGYTKLQTAPAFSFDTPQGRFESPRIFAHDAYASGSAEMSVPVFTSGRIAGTIGAATAAAAGAAALESRSVADTKLAVAEAYIGVLRAQHALEAARSSVASLEAHAGDVQVMYEREAIPHADLLAVQVSLANARQQELRARNALQIARAAYNRQIGQPLAREVELQEIAAAPATDAGSDALIAQALERRPELAALGSRREALEHSATAERAAALPQLALRAGYTHLDNQFLDRENILSAGVQVSWRLFDGGQAHARAVALRSRARAAERELADLKSRIALEVQSELLNRDDAAARVTVARAAVAQAEENLRMARELYGSGLGTNTQVLDAEALRVGAVRNRDDALLDQVLAAYRLQRAVGAF